MNHAFRVADDDVVTTRSKFKIHQPVEEPANFARWSINGYPATIHVWSQEEWSSLADRPGDAQQIPNGFWCALRME